MLRRDATGRAGLAVTTLLVVVACSSLERIPPSDHVVAAPISARANVVLRSLVTEFGSDDGRWRSCMSAGCAPIWATQFGYRAGTRRQRDDLLALGEVTAAREASLARGLAWDALTGDDIGPADEAVLGFPALLVSGAVGDRGLDGWMFRVGIARLDEMSGALGQRESAGVAALLCEYARADPDGRDGHVRRARELAENAVDGGGGTWAVLAWGALARATGDDGDIARARQALAATPYVFDPESGLVRDPIVDDVAVLSRHLSLAHGLSDLAAATGDPRLHRSAVSLVEHVFSDAWFDGRFLVHDLQLGKSENVCSGCNFMALYLVDRLFGDTFVIDPLPPLPERPDEPETPPRSEYGTVFELARGAPDVPAVSRATSRPFGPAEAWLFRNPDGAAQIGVRFTVLAPDALPPNGGLHAEVESDFGGSTVAYEMSVGTDANGVARMRLGAEPLLVLVTVRRTADGTLEAEFELRERR